MPSLNRLRPTAALLAFLTGALGCPFLHPHSHGPTLVVVLLGVTNFKDHADCKMTSWRHDTLLSGMLHTEWVGAYHPTSSMSAAPAPCQHYLQGRAPAADGINLVHEDDAGLVLSRIAKHLADEARALADVLVHNG